MTNDALSDLDDLSGLKNEGELPHLSETISYAADIAPYPFIGIHSGVGSGKNYFIDILARGYSDPDKRGQVERFPAQTILLITSRRSKVNEIHGEKSPVKKDRRFGQWDNWSSFAYDDEEDFMDALEHMRKIDCSADPWSGETTTVYQRFLPCTNAAIESYLRNQYAKSDSRTHLWNRFDMIVFDEAHAVKSDSNYQTAPYFTMRLLQETYKAQQQGLTNCKIVMMTGTPSILKDFHTPQKYHLIDRMAVCRNVTPKKIVLIDRTQSRILAEKMLTDGTRCVFFFNRTRELMTFLRKLQDKYPDLASSIAVSFSNDDKRKALEKSHKGDFDRMVDTEKYIAQNQKLPDEIRLFLTTERNKEGINIRNTDVRTMVVESHVECSVVQMAGRLREGVDTLYIVTDSVAHADSESKFEWTSVQDGEIIASYNKQLEAHLKRLQYDPDEAFSGAAQQDERISALITFVEKKHPYIIFDPFLLRFRLYRDRRKSKLYYAKQNNLFDEAKADPQKLCELVRRWYPHAEISVECSVEMQVTQYLEQRKLIGNKVTYSQQQDLLAFINDLTQETRKSLRPALKPYGYLFVSDSKHKGCSGTIYPETE